LNPALCWGGFLSLFFLAWLAIGRRDNVSWFILIAYLAQLLPWIPIPRLTFAYHYFPCSVFLALSLGRMFSVMRLNCKEWKKQIGGFVLGSILLFVLFYPVLSGAPRQQLGVWAWLPTWPF
jgi:dolichyl-phosphate-mannose--protein O-mannosyl transferase